MIIFVESLFISKKITMKNLTLFIFLLASNLLFSQQKAVYQHNNGSLEPISILNTWKISEQMVLTSSDVTLLREGFNSGNTLVNWQLIDLDADGYGWGIEWGNEMVMEGDSCISSASFINGVGAKRPDNWLISPTVTVPASAVNVLLRYNVKAQDERSYAEHYSVYAIRNTTDTIFLYSETLQESIWLERLIDLQQFKGASIQIAFRHHDCTDQFYLLIDDVHIFTNSDIDLISDTETINFTSYVGDSIGDSIHVLGLGLSNSIQATVQNPFKVSVDGINFSNNVLMPKYGGTLYIQYCPTLGGETQTTLLLTANGVSTVNINLHGKAFDCSAKRSNFEESFATDSYTLPCWQVIDANNDDNSFFLTKLNAEDNFYVYAYKFSRREKANDWLLSPEMSINNGDSLYLTYAVLTAPYAESFSLWIVPAEISNDQEIESVGIELSANKSVNNEDDVTEAHDLSAYAGLNKRIAIRCESEANRNIFIVKGFSVQNLNAPVGLEQVENDGLIVYPNPTKDIVYFTANANRVQVFNTLGQLLIEERRDFGINSVSLESLEKGIYRVRLWIGDKYTNRTVVKH